MPCDRAQNLFKPFGLDVLITLLLLRVPYLYTAKNEMAETRVAGMVMGPIAAVGPTFLNGESIHAKRILQDPKRTVDI